MAHSQGVWEVRRWSRLLRFCSFVREAPGTGAQQARSWRPVLGSAHAMREGRTRGGGMSHRMGGCSTLNPSSHEGRGHLNQDPLHCHTPALPVGCCSSQNQQDAGRWRWQTCLEASTPAWGPGSGRCPRRSQSHPFPAEGWARGPRPGPPAPEGPTSLPRPLSPASEVP